MLAILKKTVIITALNGNFRMESFPLISKLLPKADKIKLLKVYLFICQKNALFSLKIAQSNGTILVWARETYKPACRECHIFSQREKMTI